jgi:DNA polymerase elongation subunit (family B)
LVKKRFPNADVTDDNFMTEQILLVAKEVQDFINNGYNYFAKKFLNVKGGHKFDIKQECVAKSAFWVTKKRYGQWIINDGGITCDKLDVKGLDIVRSNFPPAMRDLMKVVLKDILSDVDKGIIDDKIQTFKKDMKTLPIYDIAAPTGVRGLTKYKNTKRTKFKSKTILTETKKGTPVHVKAAITHNDLLKHFKLTDSEPIRNDEKIKWIYLKDNPYGLPSLALKGYGDPKEIMDFAEKYIDRDKIFESQLRKKVVMFYDALKWDFVAEINENVGKFF